MLASASDRLLEARPQFGTGPEVSKPQFGIGREDAKPKEGSFAEILEKFGIAGQIGISAGGPSPLHIRMGGLSPSFRQNHYMSVGAFARRDEEEVVVDPDDIGMKVEVASATSGGVFPMTTTIYTTVSNNDLEAFYAQSEYDFIAWLEFCGKSFEGGQADTGPPATKCVPRCTPRTKSLGQMFDNHMNGGGNAYNGYSGLTHGPRPPGLSGLDVGRGDNAPGGWKRTYLPIWANANENHYCADACWRLVQDFKKLKAEQRAERLRPLEEALAEAEQALDACQNPDDSGGGGGGGGGGGPPPVDTGDVTGQGGVPVNDRYYWVHNGSTWIKCYCDPSRNVTKKEECDQAKLAEREAYNEWRYSMDLEERREARQAWEEARTNVMKVCYGLGGDELLFGGSSDDDDAGCSSERAAVRDADRALKQQQWEENEKKKKEDEATDQQIVDCSCFFILCTTSSCNFCGQTGCRPYQRCCTSIKPSGSFCAVYDNAGAANAACQQEGYGCGSPCPAGGGDNLRACCPGKNCTCPTNPPCENPEAAVTRNKDGSGNKFPIGWDTWGPGPGGSGETGQGFRDKYNFLKSAAIGDGSLNHLSQVNGASDEQLPTGIEDCIDEDCNHYTTYEAILN